ncbi:MAG: hypothetical protein AAFX59_12115 [Pseudomonadota bacterium]
MPLKLNIDSGASAYANPSEPITNLSFGARYISYNNEGRFLSQTNDLDPGMIVWPGGTLAETRDDRYGLDFDDLYNPATNKPGLSDMMDIANAQGAGLTVILPTARYLGDPGGLQDDLEGFLDKLLGGDFGRLPDPMVLEVGSEYFANFPAGNRAGAYGDIADLMVTEIALALSDPSVNTARADVTIAVQTGKTTAEDAVIRAAMSDEALANVDMITHHRFAYQPQGIDPRIGEVERIVDNWEADVQGAGGEAPDLFVSAWNTVTITRNGVLKMYVDDQAAQGNRIDPDSVDLDGRSHTGFERFWQSELSNAAYGQEHAAYLLESFASYAEAGMDAGSVYGIDLVHPGRLSWRDGGQDHQFVGAEMLEMIYESVGGTHVLETQDAYDPRDPVTIYGFENDDKLVMFLAAGDRAPGDIVLDLDGIGSELMSVHAERLTSETPSDWMAIFGIPDNARVDESPEADSYAMGVREVVKPVVTTGGLALDLDEAHEILRLSFAKTAKGAKEIAGFSDGKAVDLGVLPVAETVDEAVLEETVDEGGIDSATMIAEGAGGAGMGAMLLLLLLFL